MESNKTTKAFKTDDHTVDYLQCFIDVTRRYVDLVQDTIRLRKQLVLTILKQDEELESLKTKFKNTEATNK